MSFPRVSSQNRIREVNPIESTQHPHNPELQTAPWNKLVFCVWDPFLKGNKVARPIFLWVAGKCLGAACVIYIYRFGERRNLVSQQGVLFLSLSTRQLQDGALRVGANARGVAMTTVRNPFDKSRNLRGAQWAWWWWCQSRAERDEIAFHCPGAYRAKLTRAAGLRHENRLIAASCLRSIHRRAQN